MVAKELDLDKVDHLRAGYSRNRNLVEENVEKKEPELPSWVGRMCMYCISAEESRQGTEKLEGIQPVSLDQQLGSKMKVLSQSLRISTLEDVNVLEFLQKSLVRMWPDLNGFKPTDGEVFAKVVPKLLDAGIRTEVIGGLFDAMAGVACLDPILQRKYVTAAAFVSEIPPMMGIHHGNGSGNMDYKALVEIAIEKTGESAMRRLIQFTKSASKGLKELAESENGDRRDELIAVAQSSDRLNLFIKLMEEGGFRESKMKRPSPYENIIVPVAFAIGEELAETGEDDVNTYKEKMATSLVRTFRRRRISLSRKSVLGFCAAFRDKDDVNLPLLQGKDSTPEKRYIAADDFLGYGLQIISRTEELLNLSPEKREWVSNELVPEFIYQMRKNDYSLKGEEWELHGYSALGLSNDVWEDHGKRLKVDRELTVSGPEVVRSGDAVFEFSGHRAPSHQGHEEPIVEIANDLAVDDLIRAGILPYGFSGKVWVGQTVNLREKTNVKGSPDNRWNIVANSAMGIGGTFLFAQNGFPGSTAERMSLHRNRFKEAGTQTEVYGRMTGSEKLDPTQWCYTAEKEPIGWNELNTEYPHIILMQIGDYNDMQSLTNSLKGILNNFSAGCMILLPSSPEVHSSYFRDQIDELDDETLATLIHPRNIGAVRKLWGKNGPKN